MLQTLEPRWTLQAAPVGRLFVSSKSDLAHIVGIASQSMQQTPNARGPWAADNLLSRGTHRRVNTAYCHIGQPPTIHAEAAAGLSLWSALASQSASCLCTNYGINHTLTRLGGVEGMARPPHQALHAAAPAAPAALSRPLVRWLHHTAPDHLRPLVTTIATQVLCCPSHGMMTERADQPISKSAIHHRLLREGPRACVCPALVGCDEAHIGASAYCPTHGIHTRRGSSVLINQLCSICLGE